MGNQRDELVLEAVELAQPLVLRRQQPLHGLGLGAGRALALEQIAALLCELPQAPVSDFELSRQTVHDRQQGHEEREQREREDQREPEMRVASADRDGAVVLVEPDHADRSAAERLAYRREDLQDLELLLAAPGEDVSDPARDLAGEDGGEDVRVLGLGADPLVAGGVRDGSVGRDQAAANDAGQDDVLAEEPVQRCAPRRRDRRGEVLYPEVPAEICQSDGARLVLDRSRGAVSTSRFTSHEIARPAPSRTMPVYKAKRSLSRGCGPSSPGVRASTIARRLVDRHEREPALEGRIRCMATTEDRSEVGGGTEEWREKLYEAAPERQGELFSTISGLENEPLYTPDTVEIDYDRAPRLRASSVYARGYPSMYRGRLWTMRQFAGFGTAEETNERFRYLPATNRPALTAFDMPPDGLRPDHPRSLGEVGREGGGDCWPTWRRSSRASLGEVSTSMTINGPAAMLSPLRLRRRAAGYAPSSAGRSDGHPQVHRAEGVDASAGAVDAL